MHDEFERCVGWSGGRSSACTRGQDWMAELQYRRVSDDTEATGYFSWVSLGELRQSTHRHHGIFGPKRLLPVTWPLKADSMWKWYWRIKWDNTHFIAELEEAVRRIWMTFSISSSIWWPFQFFIRMPFKLKLHINLCIFFYIISFLIISLFWWVNLEPNLIVS